MPPMERRQRNKRSMVKGSLVHAPSIGKPVECLCVHVNVLL